MIASWKYGLGKALAFPPTRRSMVGSVGERQRFQPVEPAAAWMTPETAAEPKSTALATGRPN